MAFAISTGYKLAINDEAVWGTPVTSGAKYYRLEDASFKPDLSFIQSNEINAAHRQTADTVMVTAKGSGTMNGELSYASYDTLFQSLFGATFATVGTVRTLKIGQTARPLTIQEQFSDLTTAFVAYRGAFINSFSLTVQVGQITKVSFGFVSKLGTVETATVIGTPSAANTNPVMNPLADVRVIEEGGAALSGVSSLTLNVQNDITEIMALGSADAAYLRPARIKVTGTLSVFKQDSALLTKLVNNTMSDLFLTIGGASELNYEWTLPQVKYTSYDAGVSQSNPVTERFNFEGLYDETDSALKLVGNDAA